MIPTFTQSAALLSFCLTVVVVIVLVLKPVVLPVRAVKCTLKLSYCWVPLIGATLMLICGSIGWSAVAKGIAGDSHTKPYGILILFMALAYVAASLDSTGLFAWLALKITMASKGRGHLLFFLYYAMSAVMTVLTSNDVSIMTLTPIIIYTARATKCDPMPYLVAEFVAANLWSMLLFVGNPTNIIVAQAVKMTFLSYSKFMALPTIATGTLVAIQLYLTVRHQLQPAMQLPAIDPSTMLTDKFGAWFGSFNIAICLVLLALAPALDLSMWLITLIAALLHGCYNLIAHVAFDPVAGRWLGWTMILHVWQGRWIHNKDLRPRVSYTASTEAEKEADAILTAGLQPSGPEQANSPIQRHKSSHSVFKTIKEFTKSIKSYSMSRKYHRTTSSSSGATTMDRSLSAQPSLPTGARADSSGIHETTALLPAGTSYISTMSRADSANTRVSQYAAALPAVGLYMQRAMPDNAAAGTMGPYDDSVPLLSGADYQCSSSAPTHNACATSMDASRHNSSAEHTSTQFTYGDDRPNVGPENTTPDTDNALPAYSEVVKGGPRYTGSRKALALAAAAAALWDWQQASSAPSPEQSGVFRGQDTQESTIPAGQINAQCDEPPHQSQTNDVQSQSMHLETHVIQTDGSGTDLAAMRASQDVLVRGVLMHPQTGAPASDRTRINSSTMSKHGRPRQGLTWGETTFCKSRPSSEGQLDDLNGVHSTSGHAAPMQPHASVPVTSIASVKQTQAIVKMPVEIKASATFRAGDVQGNKAAQHDYGGVWKDSHMHIGSRSMNRPATLDVPEFRQSSMPSTPPRCLQKSPDSTQHHVSTHQHQIHTAPHSPSISPYRTPQPSPELSPQMYRRQYSSRTSVSCGGARPDASPPPQHAQHRSFSLRSGSDHGTPQKHGQPRHMQDHVQRSTSTTHHAADIRLHHSYDTQFLPHHGHERSASSRRMHEAADKSRLSMFAQPGWRVEGYSLEQHHSYDVVDGVAERHGSGPGDLILASKKDVDKARKERMLSVAAAKHLGVASQQQDAGQGSGQESPATVHSPSGAMLPFLPRRGLDLDITVHNSADHTRSNHAGRLARISGALRASLDIARSKLHTATHHYAHRNSFQLRVSIELPASTNALNNSPKDTALANPLPEASLETLPGVHHANLLQSRFATTGHAGRSQSLRQMEISTRSNHVDDSDGSSKSGLCLRSKSAHHSDKHSASQAHSLQGQDDNAEAMDSLLQDHDETDEHANTATSRRVHMHEDLVNTFGMTTYHDAGSSFIYQYPEPGSHWDSSRAYDRSITAGQVLLDSSTGADKQMLADPQQHVPMLPDALQSIEEADSRETSGSQINIELSTALPKSSPLKTKPSRLRHESHEQPVIQQSHGITTFHDNQMHQGIQYEGDARASQAPHNPVNPKMSATGSTTISTLSPSVGDRPSTSFRRSSSGYAAPRHSDKDLMYGPLGQVSVGRSQSLHARAPAMHRSSSGLGSSVNKDRYYSASGIGPRDSTQSSALHGRDSMHSIRSLPSIPSYLYPLDIDRPSQLSLYTDVSMNSRHLYSVYERHSLDVHRTLSDDGHHLHPQQDLETGRLLKSTDGFSSPAPNKDSMCELKPPQRNLWKTIASLPWEVVPFLLGMFVLMEGLREQGWIAIVAGNLGQATAAGGLGGGVFLMGWLGTLLSNVVNNQPMTILLTCVCLDPAFIQALNISPAEPITPGISNERVLLSNGTSPDTSILTGNVNASVTASTVPAGKSMLYHGALFAVVVGSNTGALFTLIGALAGIMWANIMKGMGVHIDYLRFLRIMLPLGVTATLSALLVLWVQLAWISA